MAWGMEYGRSSQLTSHKHSPGVANHLVTAIVYQQHSPELQPTLNLIPQVITRMPLPPSPIPPPPPA